MATQPAIPRWHRVLFRKRNTHTHRNIWRPAQHVVCNLQCKGAYASKVLGDAIRADDLGSPARSSAAAGGSGRAVQPQAMIAPPIYEPFALHILLFVGWKVSPLRFSCAVNLRGCGGGGYRAARFRCCRRRADLCHMCNLELELLWRRSQCLVLHFLS